MRVYDNGTYRDMSTEEMAEHQKDILPSPRERINELKQKLCDTDYIVLKIAEGAASFKDYAEVIKQRAEWRDEINRLEKEVE